MTVIPQQSVHRCPHYYLLTFYTGAGRHSATTANVFCCIHGNHHKTKPIILRDPDRPMFQPSSVSSFLVTLSRSLDQIQEVHIWHDISGPDPPWYLESVIICHLNTDVTWYFEAHRWLDVSTGSKEVECKLKPLPRKTYLGVKTLFDAKLNDNLKNKHLWFSHLFPNNRKPFGKFQKMSCSLAVAGIMTMIATILVQTTQSVFSNTSVRLGPWKLKLGDIHRALICSGIAFVVRLLLESLFLNSKSNRTLAAYEMNVDEYIQDCFQKLNTIVFVVENSAVDKTEFSESENISSDHSKLGEEIMLTKPGELHIEMEGADQLHRKEPDGVLHGTRYNNRGCVTDKTSTEAEKKTHSLNQGQKIEDLIDILGNLPEKEELIHILDNGNNGIVGEEDLGMISNGNVLSLDDDDLKLEFDTLTEDLSASSSSEVNRKDETVKYRRESVSWTATLTNPDKIPKLWKHLPFPHQLIDECSVKKLQRGTPKLPQIAMKVTQLHCFILPFLCTVGTIATGVHWPVSMTTSWIMTFAIAITCNIFVLETLYMLLHAIYFAKWCQRPVKEEDLLNELSNKVWVNEEQDITYYADEVVDEEEGELVPKPPTQEDIQKAQETAGRDRELEDVLKMLAFDVLFIVLLMLISFGNRDALSYPTRVGLENAFNISKGFNGVI